MKHVINLTVNGYSFQGLAITGQDEKARRSVVAVTVPALAPTVVLAALDDAVINLDDILEVVRHYLNDTGAVVRGASCGTAVFSWHADFPAIREDITAGASFDVKVTDTAGIVHMFQSVGAGNNWQAVAVCAETLGGSIRSSVATPVFYNEVQS